MREHKAYQYAILRYRHCAFTEEFVNVGILLKNLTDGEYMFSVLHGTHRLEAFFKDFSPEAYKKTIENYEDLLIEQIKQYSHISLDEMMSRITGNSGCMSWSGIGGGITDDFFKWFDRMNEDFFWAGWTTYYGIDEHTKRQEEDELYASWAEAQDWYAQNHGGSV